MHKPPRERMHNYIEFPWACSTIFGFLLFMVEVTILCWIQFYCLVKGAAYIATAILAGAMCVTLCVVCSKFLPKPDHAECKTGLKQLEELKTGLEMQNDLISNVLIQIVYIIDLYGENGYKCGLF